MWRCRKATSRWCSVSVHVGWGWYLPGRIGTRSLIGLPKRHMTGESLGLVYSDIGGWLAGRCQCQGHRCCRHDQSLGSFDTDFSSTVTVGKCYRAVNSVECCGRQIHLMRARRGCRRSRRRCLLNRLHHPWL